jgi:two-component system alkaline phosphatase synthesis response regulator PhoP
MQKVLIVEEDLARATALRRGLATEGYEVLWARDAETGIRLAAEGEVDLVVLGPTHANGASSDVYERLKGAETTAQIIVPVRPSGAGDGFDLVEAVSRVGAVIDGRHVEHPSLERYAFGDVELDFSSYRATRAGEPLELSTREFEILRHLIAQRERVVSRDELLRAVWGNTGSSVTRTVDVHIAKLRKKIGDPPNQPRYILTVHRSGYRFIG